MRLAIWQLGEFREGRASGDLTRIASGSAYTPGWIIEDAREALAKIQSGDLA